MDKVRISDLDFVYISYAEPNKEQNWADLKSKVPWAKRVDNVKGFDSAHKKAGEISESQRFITVDADTQIDEEFLSMLVDFNSLGIDDTYTLSWCGKIDLNGLQYGNGSLKCWTKEFVKEMKTHENSQGDDESLIEFCFHDQYVAIQECYSTTVMNSTDKQAWQAGFREGVKMSLDQGVKVSPDDFKEKIWYGNYNSCLLYTSDAADE